MRPMSTRDTSTASNNFRNTRGEQTSRKGLAKHAPARLGSIKLAGLRSNARFLAAFIAITFVATVLTVTAYMQQAQLATPQTAKVDLPATKNAKPVKGTAASEEASGDKPQTVGAQRTLERNRPDVFGTCQTAGPIEVESSGGTAAGTPTAYVSLSGAAGTGAFATINAGVVHQGTITIDVCGNTTELATATLTAGNVLPASWGTLAISPAGGAARTITGALALPLIDFSGADNVTIDGLNTGGNSLTISNTNTGATANTSTIRFIGGATNNLITRSSILGSFTGTVATVGGTILFSTDAVTTNGNDNNTISFCDIGPAGATLPSKAIHATGSTGTAAIRNSGNLIDQNNIHDFFRDVNASGIHILNGNDNWTISTNRIYQSAPRVFTTGASRYAGITLNTAQASLPGAFAVSGNVIGFGAANGTGTTTTSGSSNEFRGIDAASVSTTTATNITNNTISGINQTSSRGSATTANSAFIGVVMGTTDGLINATGNTIGSLAGSSTIVLNLTQTTAPPIAPVLGFYNFSFFSTNISSNNIGAITIQSTGTTTGFIGILVNTASATTATLNSNTIGGAVAGGAITNTQVGSYSMFGIQSALPNTTANLNIIRNMSGASTAATSIVSAGILLSGSTGANTISQNTIHSLSNASGAASNSIYGMSLSLPATANVIERNLIHSLSMTSTVATGQLWGIAGGATGTATYKNNMIRLGLNAAGSSITTGFLIIGIRDSAGATNNFYHNSIYVGGSGVLAAPAPSNSYCFFSDVVTVTRNFQDNIFWNARSNAVGGGVAHVAIRVGGTAANPPGLTSNYNDLYFTGTDGATGVFNAAVVPNLAAWKTATGQDANSLAGDPQFIAPTGTAATVDLHIHPTNPTPIESAGLAIGSVTDDYDGQGRAGLTPTDIGADAGNFAIVVAPGTVEFSATSYTGLEGEIKTITVNRLGGSSGAISVDYATGGGSATGGAACTAGVDYISTSGTLNWADTITTPQTFNVQLCVDGLVDPELLQLTLSNPVGTTITGTNPVNLNITDNAPGTIQFSSITYSGDEGTTATITATRTGGTGGAVQVDYATGGGSATSGAGCGGTVDYVATSNTLMWGNLDGADKTFTVQLCTDSNFGEGAETVTLTLSNVAGGATVGANNPATLTINDVGASYCNGAITIPAGAPGTTSGPATPYPTTVVVAGLVGNINTLKVRLNSIVHTDQTDIDMLLVSPTGQKFILMSDAGNASGFDSAVSISISDAGATFPGSGAVSAGDYKPQDNTSGDTFVGPAPAGPYVSPAPVGAGTLNGTFGGQNPNGTWQLFVVDDASSDVGSIASWCLEITTDTPTAVKLMSFTAQNNNGEVSLQWQTGYEAHNLGYIVYREENGKREQITPSLIAGSALTTGSQTVVNGGLSYTWTDDRSNQQSAISNRQSKATYWLEDVDLDGTRTLHGPIAASIGTGKRAQGARSPLLSEIANRGSVSGTSFRSWAGAFAKQEASFAKASVVETGDIEQQKVIAAQPGIKLAVSKEGWQRVTQPELVAAGFDANANAAQLQLYSNGYPVAIKLSGDQAHLGATDYLEFYGHGLDTPTDAAQTYYLVVKPDGLGTRITDAVSGGQIPPPSGAASYQYTVERRDRWIYYSAFLNGDEGNIFGHVVQGTPVSETLPVSQLDSSGGAAQLEVSLVGLSLQAHHVRVSMNGTELGMMDFAGAGHPSQTFSVPAALVHDGDNTVEFVALDGSVDASLVDTVRLTYAHRYTADSNALSLGVNTEETRRVGGFTSDQLRAVDITDLNNVVELTAAVKVTAEDGGTYAADLQVAGASTGSPHTVLVFAEGTAGHPETVRGNQPSSWSTRRSGADYAIITSREFATQVEPLAALRRSQGMTVNVIDVEDLYDEFSYGQHTPQAIHDYLAQRVAGRGSRLHYVLFAGDSSFDPKNYLGQGNTDYVPTKLVDTGLMETASDDWLADFNGDGVADLSLGRLPLRTAADAELMVGKIISYEQMAPDPTRGATLVADNSFEAASASVQALLPAGMPVQTINRSSADDATIHNQIITSLNQGPRVVNFVGHGGNGTWTGALLLSIYDAPDLTNSSHLSVYTMMTCMNGYFQNAYIDSLSEALMRTPGGAVAVWSSTGMTVPDGQNQVNQEFYRQLFGGSSPRLGDAVRAAKQTTGDADVRRTWILFGDPAMRMH